MKAVFVSLPSVRGVHPQTTWNLFNARNAFTKDDGCYLAGGSSLYRMPLALARNEQATAFLSTSADINFLLDDDVQVQEDWWPKMAKAVLAGVDIVTAPCRLRDHAHGGAQAVRPYNIWPVGGDSTTVAGVRLLECERTGLGAVMVSRKVLQTLFDNGTKYASKMLPGALSADIFRDEIVPASTYAADADLMAAEYILDDLVFSRKARAANFRIMAAIDAPTVHDGMAGCFAADLERLNKARDAAQARRSTKPLLGPDGKPLGGER